MPQLAKIGNFLAILCFCFAAQAAEENIKVRATVDPKSADPQELINYTITVEITGEGQVSTPSLNKSQEFEVISRSSGTQTRSVMVSTPNGPKFTTTRVITFGYQLRALKEGLLRVRPAEVVVNGKPYLTPELTLQVAKGASGAPRNRPRPPPGFDGEDEDGLPIPPGFPPNIADDEDDLFSQLLRRGLGQRGVPGVPGGGAGGSKTFPMNPKDAFFIQVETDKTDAYVGEQITVSWYLYTRGSIREIDTLKYPALKGFWKEDIEMATALNFVQEVVNGIPYRKALLASYAIFPIKEGTAVIDSYTAKCSVVSADDIMGQFGMGKAMSFTKSSQPIKVSVKPLPASRPADFSGGVGDFQVTAKIDDHNIVENQPFTYTLRFDGRGNSKLIDLPPFEPPQGLERYDVQNDAKFFKTGTSYKEFKILLIPRRTGDFTIPSVSASMFDTVSGKYITRHTDPLQISVGKGQPGQNLPPTAVAPGKPTEEAIPMPPPEPELVLEYRSRRVLNRQEQTVAFGVLILAIMFTLLWRAREELGWGEKKRTLLMLVENRLKKARSADSKGDLRGVGTELTNAIYFVLGQTVGEVGSNLPFDEMIKRAPPSVRRELSEPLRKLHDKAQLLSFAPLEAVKGMFQPKEVKELLSTADSLLTKAVNLAVSAEPTIES